MKKIISGICIAIALSCFSTAFAEVSYGIKVKNPFLDLPVDEATIMKNGAIIYEAENMVYDSTINVIQDDSVSGGAYLKTTGDGITEASALTNPTISFTYTVNEANTYYFWVKMRTYNATTNSSIHYSLNGGGYQTLWGFAEEGNPWQWRLLGSSTLTEGTATLEFKKRLSGFQMDKVLITSNTSYSAEGSCDPESFSADSSAPADGVFPEPPYYPIDGHPRLIITKAYLPQFKQNLQSDELAPMFKNCLAFADEELNCNMGGTKYDDAMLNKLKARAIAYISGARDDVHARQTIDYMKQYMSTCYYNPSIGDITRNIGDCMFTGAIIYDWCYDQMTSADKDFFIRQFKILAGQKEIGYPPIKMPCDISGHSGEQEIFQDLVGAGIAIYDEDKEMYDLAAGRLFANMAPSRTYFNKTGAHPVTLEYSFWRHSNEGVADLIFSRMGYGHIFGDDMYRPAIKNIYQRLGMGKWVKNGDSFQYAYNTSFEYDTYDYQEMTIMGNLYKNPYLRGQYIRDMAIKGNQFNFWAMVCAEPDAPIKSEEDMPLAYKSTYPLTSVTARTSWKHGIDSPAAVVYMEGREKVIADHQHMKLGDFSVYYKGNLAIDSGTYNGSSGGYGCEHDINYYKRTISGNCVTVFDPNEQFYFSLNSCGTDGYFNKTGTKVSNDGGQIFRENIANLDRFLSMKDFARTDAVYIGPNEKTPEFSYLKTDLTNAYSDKIKNYNRYMAFMDLDNEKYPAALVVFDVVESSNKSFKKTWNLHCIEEPEINGNTTTIKRTEHGFGGKLVNKTFLPSENGFTIDKVGGPGKEAWVNGHNYLSKPNANTINESADWRIEISPSYENCSDSFLNAMYVTDADAAEELPMYKEQSTDMVGVSVLDRMIMFSKTANHINSQTAVTLRDVPENTSDSVKCMITDAKAGLWEVKEYQTNNSFIVEVKEDEHILYFRGEKGKSYILTPVSSGTPVINVYPAMDKEKHGDFEIHDGTRLVYDKHGTKLFNGVPYVPARSILTNYGLDVAYNDTTKTVTVSNSMYTFEFDFNSDYVRKNGESVLMPHRPLLIDGVTYISLGDYKELAITSYNDYAKLMKITIPDYSRFTQLDTAHAITAVGVTSGGDDGNAAENTIDYNPNTRWSCNGDGSWIKLDYGEVYDIDYAQIFWHNGNVRVESFEIFVSDDDVNYTRVFNGQSDGRTEGFEKFAINHSGRYVKIVCHNNTQGTWNSIREIFVMRK